jgi:transcriptional regulator of acetoin/glycerol metabolism
MLLGQQRKSSVVASRRRTELPLQASKALQTNSGLSSLHRLNTGDSRAAYNIRCAERVLDKDISILLQGETGTGKEVFARAIHTASSRAEHAFIAINCGAIPEQLIESELFGYKDGAFTGARRGGMRGKIEQANGGTLFLDEIGDMPLHLQTRLLRVLEERQVTPLGGDKPLPIDVQIISASHCDLEQMMQAGDFREDLYYRLNGIALRLPALRERTDFHALTTAILESEAGTADIQLSSEAFAILQAYAWPGNLRQLKNVLRTALALSDSDEIRPADLPPDIQSAATSNHLSGLASGSVQHLANQQASALDALQIPEDQQHLSAVPASAKTLKRAERDALLQVLNAQAWNITSTAAQLGISRNTLYRKMHKHDLQPKQFR